MNAIVNGTVESTGDAQTDLVSDIEAIPADLDFESVSSSRAQVRPIILRNSTSRVLTISEIFIEASPLSGFNLNTECKKLDPGQACLASVTWTPTQEGEDSGVMVIRHDGASGITSVPIEGDYDPETAEEAEIFPSAVPGKGLLVSSQTEIDFGSDIDSKSSITVSLVNSGDAPLTIDGFRLNNPENGMIFAPNGCDIGTVLSPVEACALTLEWEPIREGDVVDDVQIYHTGAHGILVIPVRGSATQAVNKDSASIVLTSSSVENSLIRSIPKLDPDTVGVEDDDENEAIIESQLVRAQQPVDLTGVLDGFVISSLAKKRAIINGPGGSRVISDDEETVIGGVLWNVNIRSSSVEFSNGDQRVLLLFDKSLSSVNRNGAESGEDNSQ